MRVRERLKWVNYTSIMVNGCTLKHLQRGWRLLSSLAKRVPILSLFMLSIQISEEIELIFNTFTSCQLFHLVGSLGSFINSFHLSSIQILEEIELIFNAFTSCQLFHLFCSLDSFFLSFHLLSIQISEEIEVIFQCFHKLPNVSPRLFFRQLFSCFF